MLPAVVVIAGISLGVNALARGRYLAYFALIALGAWYLGSAAGGASSPLWNPLLLGHLGYSDMTGPEPFAKRLGLTHAYWGALVACLLLLATWFFPRSGPWRPGVYFSRSYARRRTGLLVLLGLATAGAVASGRRLAIDAPARASDEQREAAALALEDRHRGELGARPGPSSGKEEPATPASTSRSSSGRSAAPSTRAGA